MTAAEKAKETRAKNMAKQKQDAEARSMVRNAILAACIEVIKCEEIKPSEKLTAALLLDTVRKERY